MKISIRTSQTKYDVFLGTNILLSLNDFYDFSKYHKILVVSDSGVPPIYINYVLQSLPNALNFIFKQGEENKSFDTFIEIQRFLLKNKFTRKDLIIALGGGVVGDIVGFVASSYKRGIDYINIPTTTLSQIDSSIGGKCAINLDGIKNVVGAFYQPKCVIIDFETLKTLDKYQFNSGLVEALKSSLIGDEKIIDLFNDISNNYKEIIYRALLVKKEIVSKDVFEKGIRKILNLGHTIAHPLELLNGISHGEAVGIGLLKVILNHDLKNRIQDILSNELELKTTYVFNDSIVEMIFNDKKVENEKIELIFIDKNKNIITKLLSKKEISCFVKEENYE